MEIDLLQRKTWTYSIHYYEIHPHELADVWVPHGVSVNLTNKKINAVSDYSKSVVQ